MPTGGGYTQLNSFGKPILNQNLPSTDAHTDMKMNQKTPIVATTDQAGISGKILLLALNNCHFQRLPDY